MPFPNHVNDINTNQNFEAYIKADDGKIFEMGYASISSDRKAVDFVSDFVPILEMKTPVIIVKLIDGRECHSYEGKVYLSSKTRLQISDVCDRLLSYQEMTLQQQVSLTGTIYAISFLPSKKKGDPPKKELKIMDVEIFSISLREIGFTVKKSHSIETHLLLHINDPLRMDDVELEVFRQLQFSENKNVCYATFESTPAGSRKVLIDFLASRLILFP